ncbi:hypothetical protein D3C78_1023450 [compost metagenome]
MAGADQGDLGVTAVAEQIVAAAGAFRFGGELVHVLHGVAGAAQLPGNVVQGAGLAHAPGLVGLEFLARDTFEGRHLVYGIGHDSGCTFGAVRRPVLVTTEVEVLALLGGRQLFVGQRRQVRHVVAHAGEALEHGLVVAQGLLVIEGGFLGRVEHVAVHQATGRLVHHHQFHAALLERVVHLLQALVAGRGGIELGAQVFAGTEQPVALGLHQRGEVLLVTGGVAAGVMRFRAQLAARLGAEGRGLDVFGAHALADRQEGSGQAQQFHQMWSHGLGFLNRSFRSGVRPGRSARPSAGAPAGRGFRPGARPGCR